MCFFLYEVVEKNSSSKLIFISTCSLFLAIIFFIIISSVYYEENYEMCDDEFRKKFCDLKKSEKPVTIKSPAKTWKQLRKFE